LDATKQYREGLNLLKAGDYTSALKLLEFASECDPGKAIYLVHLAWCRFCQNASEAPKANHELEKARRMNAQCGEAYFYSGKIMESLVKKKEAEAFYRQACKHMKNDRRPVEALKILIQRKT